MEPIIIYKTYTEAQKRAIYKYRLFNKDKINAKRRETYHKTKLQKKKL